MLLNTQTWLQHVIILCCNWQSGRSILYVSNDTHSIARGGRDTHWTPASPNDSAYLYSQSLKRCKPGRLHVLYSLGKFNLQRKRGGKKNSQRSSEEVFEQNFRSVRAPGLGLWPFFFYPTGLQRPWHMSGGAVCPLSGYRHEPVALQEHSHRTLPCLGSHAQPCRCQKSQVFPRGSGFSKPHWYFPSFCIDSAWHSLGC